MFKFDKKSQRYRNKSTGRFMSQKQVTDLLENQIDLIKKDMITITTLLIDNKISVGTWEEQIGKAIKSGNIIAYALGKGGKNEIDSSDYLKIEAKLRFEYGYLRKFSEQIIKGELSENQIRDRITKYADGFYTMYEQARRISHAKEGYRWERRYTSPGEVCVDCVRYSVMGWQVIGTLPAIGQQSRCMSRCRCEFRFSSAEEKPTNLLRDRSGWLSAIVR